MINTQNLISKICAKIDAGGLTSLESCQTSNALTFLSNTCVSVATCSSLPNATEYNGRMIYVNDENRYYYAIEGVWNTDFQSTISCIANQCQALAWGGGANGRLGDNTATNKSSPVSVVGGFSDWVSLSTGQSHTIGLRSNGALWGWGANTGGSVGDCSTTARSSPVSVVGGFTDWCQISAGGNMTLAVRTNGTAWGWGCNDYGRLGVGTLGTYSSPVSVIGGFTDWCQVSASHGTFQSHSLGVRTNGTAWAWGLNSSGQLGDGTTVSKRSPVSVIGGFTDWCQVAAGVVHSAGVRSNGSLWTWGAGTSGGLGDCTVAAKSSPVSVVGGFTDWCKVCAASSNTIAIRTNGTIWGWGSNNCGQLGNNSNTSTSSPVSVVGGFTDWCAVSMGTRNTVAIRTNGSAWAWGRNSYGGIGDGTITVRSSPVSILSANAWRSVSSGYETTTGVRVIRKGC